MNKTPFETLLELVRAELALRSEGTFALDLSREGEEFRELVYAGLKPGQVVPFVKRSVAALAEATGCRCWYRTGRYHRSNNQPFGNGGMRSHRGNWESPRLVLVKQPASEGK